MKISKRKITSGEKELALRLESIIAELEYLCSSPDLDFRTFDCPDCGATRHRVYGHHLARTSLRAAIKKIEQARNHILTSTTLREPGK